MFVQVSEQLIDEVSVVLITNVGTTMGEIVSDYSGALSDSRAREVWFSREDKIPRIYLNP